jgi:hypothetical protein
MYANICFSPEEDAVILEEVKKNGANRETWKLVYLIDLITAQFLGVTQFCAHNIAQVVGHQRKTRSSWNISSLEKQIQLCRT